MLKRRSSFRGRLVFLLAMIILLPIGMILFFRLEGETPQVRLDPAVDILGVSQELSLSVTDGKSGLRSLKLSLVSGDKEVVLIEKRYPSAGILGGGALNEVSETIKIEPRKLGFSAEKAVLRLEARDYSWRKWLHGNPTLIEKEVSIDTTPPEIMVLSQAHNVNQGGVGLVIYRLSEACTTSGIQVDETLFPGQSGHFEDPMIHMAFFALNHQPKAEVKLVAKAADVAGNTSTIGFYHHIRKKRFKPDIINISDRFLQRKIPEFEPLLPEGNSFSEIEKFLWINSDLRKATYDRVVKICSTSEPIVHWEGAFLRMPNSKRMAGYADSRDYKYKDKVINFIWASTWRGTVMTWCRRAIPARWFFVII